MVTVVVPVVLSVTVVGCPLVAVTPLTVIEALASELVGVKASEVAVGLTVVV
jgi:hypothetical protein